MDGPTSIPDLTIYFGRKYISGQSGTNRFCNLHGSYTSFILTYTTIWKLNINHGWLFCSKTVDTLDKRAKSAAKLAFSTE
jgi:hypothetical protein